MQKVLDLRIDRSSWYAAPPSFQKPCPFPARETRTNINFLSSLLWTGITALSIRMPQWWLASHWAILRYFAAADHTRRRLRLHEAAEDLETHAKQVLSDDWGVGISLQWLTTRFGYSGVCHARPVLKNLEAAGIARFRRKSKRGPAKCPDFLAFDAADNIYVIECKANQDGMKTTRNQFQSGRQQKRNIRFSNESLVAQRLLSGVAIAAYRSRWKSTLLIADPPSNEKSEDSDGSVEICEINTDTPGPITRSINKMSIVQGLLLGGAFIVARRVFPNETDTLDQKVNVEVPLVEFTSHRARWRGQTRELLYPIPIRLLDGTTVTGSRLRFGISEKLMALLNENRFVREDDSKWDKLNLDIRLDKDSRQSLESRKEDVQRYASILHGDLLISDFELLEA